MGFKAVKKQVIDCLNTGNISHEQRNAIDIKNLLATGQVNLNEIVTIIGRAKGSAYSSSPHHFDDSIEVHVVKTVYGGHHWYIKWYFVEPNSIFISVHH
jgi:hypothetical protein